MRKTGGLSNNFTFKKFNRQKHEKTRKRKVRCFQAPQKYSNLKKFNYKAVVFFVVKNTSAAVCLSLLDKINPEIYYLTRLMTLLVLKGEVWTRLRIKRRI
jgi:hypothetical protein